MKRRQALRSRRNWSKIHSIMIVSGLSIIFDLHLQMVDAAQPVL